jgi:hypothetical protein
LEINRFDSFLKNASKRKAPRRDLKEALKDFADYRAQQEKPVSARTKPVKATTSTDQEEFI